MNKKPPILVTGSHRSGTTWIGKTLCLDTNLLYINEPFNIERHNNAPFPYQYFSIDYKFQSRDKLYYEKYVESFFKVNNVSIREDVGKSFRYLIGHSRQKLTKQPLLKDPIALFSAEWFFKKYDAQILICIRHPAAFVSSLKVKSWYFNFNNIYNQKGIVKRHFKTYESQLYKYSNEEQDIIDQGILLWNLIYSYVAYLQSSYPDWIYIKHEDLSWDPVGGFNNIFDSCNLEYTDAIANIIIEQTSNNKSDLIRNSQEVIHEWKERLTVDEIARVKQGTSDVYPHFYKEEDW